MFTGIDEMLRSARDNFESMERDYQASLTRQEIPINMLNKVRALLAELRDPLDHIYKLIPGAANSNFPVSNSENHFLNYTRGISQNVIPILEEVQVFKDRTQWLKNFAALSNIHKHITLIPQKRQEQRQVAVAPTQGGGNIIFDPSAVQFGRGVSMFGVPVDPSTQLPIPSSTITTTVMVWVDFIFDPDNQELRAKLGDNVQISALNFLRESLNRVQVIVDRLKTEIPIPVRVPTP